MKRLIPLVLVALALAAVPAALADNGGSTPTAPTPSGQAQTGPAAQAGGPLAELRIRLRLVEQRFARNCGANAAATRLERCADRKSTRLNSSHSSISYAVFCLK